MPDVGFLAAALAGLTGSLHCVAMCGGFVAAAGRRGGAQPLRPAHQLRALQVPTQLGRLSVYLLLGAGFGATGATAFALQWPAAQRLLYGLANVALLLTAVRMAHPALAQPLLERAGLALFRQVAPLTTRGIAVGGLPGRFALGMLWGMTPCALIYGLLPVALLSGSASAGAGVMLGLWLGTLPALLFATGLASRLGTRRSRRVAAGVVAAFALAGLYRVLFAAGLPAGPFCLAP